LIDCSSPVVFFGDIQSDEQSFAASLGDLRLDRPPLFLRDVSDDYFGTLAGEDPGLFSAHPACAA